jgi:hypothetical protein
MASELTAKTALLMSLLGELRPSQLEWLERIALILHSPIEPDNHKSDLLSGAAWADFGDILRIHHAFSEEALSKDRFEYALAGVLTRNGRTVSFAPRGTCRSFCGKPWTLSASGSINIQRCVYCPPAMSFSN